MDIANSQNSAIGYLIVKVSTARGAIPLEGASVTVRGGSDELPIIITRRTNASGLTEKIALPTPPRSLSEAPGNILPFAVYGVDVFLDGYYDNRFSSVAVFDSVTSIQPAIMIPLADNGYTDNYTPSEDQSPDDRNF